MTSATLDEDGSDLKVILRKIYREGGVDLVPPAIYSVAKVKNGRGEVRKEAYGMERLETMASAISEYSGA